MAASYTFKDTFDNGGGSAVDLGTWSITHPHPTLGGTGWESTGATSAIQVQTWDAIRSTGAATVVFRTTGDFKDDRFELVSHMSRLSTDAAASCSACFHVKNTTIGSFDNREYYRVQMARWSTNSVLFSVHHIDAAGSVNTVVSLQVSNVWASGSGSPSGKWVRIRVEGLRCRVWIDDTDDFATEVGIIDVTLPVDYRGSNHLRVGVQLGAASAGDFVIGEFRALDLEADSGITDPSTIVGTIPAGHVLRVEREDNEIEEWVVATHDDDVDKETTTITALPVDAWLAERIQIRSADGLAVTYDGALDSVLAQLLATVEVPPWLVLGTVAVNPRVTGTWNKQNIIVALRQAIAGANEAAEIVLARQVVRYEFVRTSATVWTLNVRVAAASGTPGLAEGKQITGLRLTTDRTREAQVIYPVNNADTSIAYAYFRVANVESDILLTLVDWSTAPSVIVVEDGQWVGQFIVAPDGTTYEITDSFAATGKIECASLTAGDLNIDDLVRFAVDNTGTPSLAVALPNRKNPKKDTVAAPWPSVTNWALNSQMRTLDGVTAEPEGYVASDGAETALSVETVLVKTGAQALKWSPAGVGEHVTMDTITVPSELWDSVTVHYGVEYHALNPTAVTIQHFIVGTGAGSGSWVEDTVLTSDGNWHTRVSSIGYPYFNNTGFRIRLRSTNNIELVVDRVWILFAGQESETRVEGCGPALGLSYGNWEMEQRQTAGRAFEVGIVDLYRRDPVRFAEDRLALHQECRIVAPSRGVDTLRTISELVVDELRVGDTQVTIGARLRRLTDPTN